MATVRVMYWKEIPVQVQASDGSGSVSRPLDPRFQQAVDAIAMFDGSAGTDAYLSAWEWGPYVEATGSAKDAAERLATKYNSNFPLDLVRIVRDAHRAGSRNPAPQALDHLIPDDT